MLWPGHEPYWHGSRSGWALLGLTRLGLDLAAEVADSGVTLGRGLPCCAEGIGSLLPVGR